MNGQRWVVLVFALAVRAEATVFYVDAKHPQASDTNPGTAANLPWKTIQKAASAMGAGDTVNIAAGTYDESIVMQNGGTATSPITYQASSKPVVLTQDLVVGKSHVVVRGLELSGASLRVEGSWCQIIDNFVHHAGTCGLFLHGTYNLIRGNRIANNGASWGDQVTTGWDNGNSAHHYVFEGNDVSDPEGKGEDLMQYLGHDAIIRNNVFHHLGSNGRHNDGYQSAGGEYNIWMLGNRFENLNDVQYYMTGSGDHDHVWRGNLFWGSIGWGFNGTPTGMRVMNNTFSVFGSGGNWGVGGVGKALNNIFSPPGSDGHHGDVDYGLVSPVPCCSDRGPHDLWGVDPKFVDFTNRDFHLQSTSRAINAGTFLTTATSSGSGTQLPVADAKLFVDGFGVAEGDLIQLQGQTQTARITSINDATNTLTLDRALTWTSGQGVSLPYSGSAPDLGAFEFGEGSPAVPSAPSMLRVQ